MKKFVKRIFPLLPPKLQQLLRNEAERRRQVEKKARKERTFITEAELVGALRELNIDSDLILHSSISNIGKFEIPVQKIAELITQEVNLKRNTLLVPALPFNTSMKEYLEKGDVFDVRTARNAMGAIPNILMSLPGAKRSIHPTHSVVALGPEAAFYVDGHEKDCTPFGPSSPFYKLTARKGKILLLGVGLNSVTNFHVYEDILGPDLPFEVYSKKKYRARCIDNNGDEMLVETPCHEHALSAQRECERARPYLIAADAITTLPFGESEISLIDAKKFTETLLQMLLDGKSIYGEAHLSITQRESVTQALDKISCT